jgi:hypothetical protein
MDRARNTLLLFVLLSIFGIGNVFAQSPIPKTTASKLSNPQKDSTQIIDLADLVPPQPTLGRASFIDGELFMSSKNKGFYYVLVARKEYSAEGAITRVKLRNLKGVISNLGYGLIFHSDPEPIKQDYAFLIDTIKRSYRVVRHAPGEEISVIQWTKSKYIRGGKRQNILEVRDKGDRTELFINRRMVTSIEKTYAFKSGYPGLYSGDAVEIAFKDLTIRK